MVITRGTLVTAALLSALFVGACSSDGILGGPQTTSAIPEKPKVDPACVTLASQIDALRREGVADRVEQASKGKGTTVAVKRESLAKVAELNKANASFQARCGTVTPAAVSAPATPAATPPKAVSSAPPAKPKTASAAPAKPAANPQILPSAALTKEPTAAAKE